MSGRVYALKLEMNEISTDVNELENMLRIIADKYDVNVKRYYSECGDERIQLISFDSKETAKEALKEFKLDELIKYVDDYGDLWLIL